MRFDFQIEFAVVYVKPESNLTNEPIKQSHTQTY